MKKIFIFFVLFSLLAGWPQVVPAIPAQGAPGVLVVRVTDDAFAANLPQYGTQVEKLFDREYRVEADNAVAAAASLNSRPWVEFAARDTAVKTAAIASDPLFVLDEKELTKQWYLPKMKVDKAWEKTTGNSQTIIAVVDTGIDGKHEDLNDGRVTSGYVSYCQVVNTAKSNDCLIRTTGELAPGVNSDDNGHGTIVAGIIGAIPNNNTGISGIDWNVQLMPIKVLDANGFGLSSDVAAGMHWAVDHGARIINLSVGGPGLEGSQIIQEAVKYAFNKGVLVVAAAGNDGSDVGGNLNDNPVYPVCADGGQNMIVGVAAIDIQDRKAAFSNYGSNCVDIAAPGTGTFIDRQNRRGIVSTYFDPLKPGENDLYVYAIGTSIAAPMISGVAGLEIAAFPDLDVKALRDRLLSSTDNIDDLNGTGCGGNTCVGQIGRGRINALKAVTDNSAFTSGSLVKNSDGNVYLIERGLKRHVSQFVLGQMSVGWVMTNATPGQLDSFPTGSPVPPIDGTIVKGPDDPTVYVVEGGELHGMSYLAFISRGFRFGNVVVLPLAELNGYIKGSLAAVSNGALLKSQDNPAVYVLDGGKRQLLSYFVFLQRNFQNQPIAVLSANELAQYPVVDSGLLYPPIDGTLIRGDLDPTVYLVEGGILRAMTFAAFQNRGFSFASVKIVPVSEIGGYQLGQNIFQ